MENKTITITKTMSLPVEEILTLPAFMKGDLGSYLIVPDETKCLYFNATGDHKIETCGYPQIYIRTWNMNVCDKDEVLKVYNEIAEAQFQIIKSVTI